MKKYIFCSLRIKLLFRIGLSNYILSVTDVLSVYVPYLKVKNVKEIKTLKVLGSPSANYFWMEPAKSTFGCYERSQITLYCQFDFNSFPFDSHNCNLSLGIITFDYKTVALSPPLIYHEEFITYYGQEPIKITEKNSQVPFDATISVQERRRPK